MLVPSDVAAYRAAGFDVFVETGIGAKIGFPDGDYEAGGTNILSCDRVWEKPYVVKYKAPQPDEFRYFRDDLTLATSFHPEGEEAMITLMCRSGMTGYSLEYAVTPDNIRPLPVTDMEIAGKLAFIQGAYLLQTHFGGSGVLLSHIPGVKPAKVLVIGHGNVGGSAARFAAAAGCDVTVLGRNRARLRQFAATVPGNVRSRLNGPDVIDEEIREADLVIGAILIATEDTPAMIERRHLATMKKGSLIMDVTCGYGDGKGWMPTFRSTTTIENPVYEVDGVLHFKMDRMPSRMPRTASEARSKGIAPYLIELGQLIFAGEASGLFDSCRIVSEGKICNAYLKSIFADCPPMQQFM